MAGLLGASKAGGLFLHGGHATSKLFLFVGVSGWSGWARDKEETLMTINASNIANTIFRNEKMCLKTSFFNL